MGKRARGSKTFLLLEPEIHRRSREIITSLRQCRLLLLREPRRYASNLDFPIPDALPSLAIIENLEGDSHVKSNYFRTVGQRTGALLSVALFCAYLSAPSLAPQRGGDI